MRINLDEPVSDESPLPAATDEPDSEVVEGGADRDELIIRRDLPTARRRRRGPKPLTPAQQRVLGVFLVAVIIVAFVSLGAYWRNALANARRLPAPVVSTRSAASRAPTAPSGSARQTRPAARPPIYQGPPPRGSEPLSSDDADPGTPAEGIH